MFGLGQNLTSEGFQLWSVNVIFFFFFFFLIDFSVLNQNIAMFRYLIHYLRRKIPTKIFQRTLATIFGQFTLFQYRFDLPQVKRDLITSIT